MNTSPHEDIDRIATRIASKMDGRTVVSHEHYRQMLKKELMSELTTFATTEREQGRVSVLQDFDNLCEVDAVMGFTDDEWKAVQKFFAYNKQISGWDNPQK
jgi:hypothetical protein